MKPREKLIISLIKDDLINTKLIRGLDELGLDSGKYFLHLSDTIFMLIGIKENKKGEKLFEHYLALKHKVRFIDITKSYEALDNLALSIYIELINKKSN